MYYDNRKLWNRKDSMINVNEAEINLYINQDNMAIFVNTSKQTQVSPSMSRTGYRILPVFQHNATQ